MNKIVDARGLSCPQPVMITLEEIKKVQEGEIVIMVDTDTARENVCRASEAQNWAVAEVQPEDDGYRITIRKEG